MTESGRHDCVRLAFLLPTAWIQFFAGNPIDLVPVYPNPRDGEGINGIWSVFKEFRWATLPRFGSIKVLPGAQSRIGDQTKITKIAGQSMASLGEFTIIDRVRDTPTNARRRLNSPPEPPIDELREQSRQGNREAFGLFFSQRRPQIKNEIRAKMDPMLLQRVDASDIAQELFLDADRRLQEVKTTSLSIEVWLRILMKQKLIDLRRRHVFAEKRSIAREQRATGNPNDTQFPDQLGQLSGHGSSPSLRLRRVEISNQLRSALDRLSEVDREILVLRHYQSMTNGEAAELLQISVNAASNRYVRALQRFQELLGDSEES